MARASTSANWMALYAQVWPRYDAKTDEALALTVPEPLQTPGKPLQRCGDMRG